MAQSVTAQGLAEIQLIFQFNFIETSWYSNVIVISIIILIVLVAALHHDGQNSSLRALAVQDSVAKCCYE